MAGFDIKFIKGVGEKRSQLLAAECDIHTLRDLLCYFPNRYVDRSRYYLISEFDGEMPAVQVRGRFVRFSIEGEGARRRLVALFTDGRSMMEVIWFSRVDSMRTAYSTDKTYVLFGKPNFYRGAYSMAHPEVELYEADKPAEGFRGIYPMTETLRKRGFTQKVIQTIVRNAMASKEFARMADPLPPEIVSSLRLMPFAEAVAAMHFPTSPGQLSRAKMRMKFEELFYLELHILRYSTRRSHTIRGYVFPHIGDKFNSFFYNVIPFPLTDAQKRVLREIRSDMRTGRQMNRLLQGDVGCGKTLVAFMSMLMAIDNGYQTALMAPTEILATQHYESLKPWCEALGLNLALLTGSTGTRARREIDAALADGSLHILVGTHALLEEHVVFQQLGIAVIDEQHRFGVAQRARMWAKGTVPPHVLVMTATPIPRTLAMTVYGDLDVSVIDELPPGRKPVTTLLRYDENRREVDRLLASQLAQGRQVYIVYPLIHENEKLSLRSLEKDIDYVREKFPQYRVCHVHGQMKPAEKDHQMELFVTRQAQIMVATTVIEVGVNVPNATVMVIENAERFGLAQLHQLRGRVGRGADRSFCVLMTKCKIASETRKRLKVMTDTTDGFLVSEADMKMRGPGDMEGTQQSGLAFTLRVANLATDGQIISLARDTAERVLKSNPGIAGLAASAPDSSSPSAENSLPLSAASQRILTSELSVRFAGQIDWSLIS